MLGDGTGSFGAQTEFATGARPRARDGDFNKDGKRLPRQKNQQQLNVLLGAGDGTFGAR
ncbi:MAG: hypothetical protein U0Y68_24275 [Blastocatellia bacterium]